MLSDVILQPGGVIVADASSLILLNKLALLRQFCHLKMVIVSQQVFDELTQGGMCVRYDAVGTYRGLHTDNLLQVHSVASDVRALPLTPVDASTVLLYLQLNAQALLTDDGGICRYCRKSDILYLNTPLALFTLAYNKHIARAVFEKKLTEVYRIGRYGSFVREYMRRVLRHYWISV